MAQPTQELIRKARHTGFANSITHLPEEKRKKLQAKYEKQDANRECIISKFINQVGNTKGTTRC